LLCFVKNTSRISSKNNQRQGTKHIRRRQSTCAIYGEGLSELMDSNGKRVVRS
jgi:hypothetical protein